MNCSKCNSENIVWSTMKGIFCKDCGKCQYENSPEEDKINRILLGNGKDSLFGKGVTA